VRVVGSLTSTFLGWLHPARKHSAADSDQRALITAASKWCDSCGGGIPSRRMVEEANEDLGVALATTQIPMQLIAKLTR
jgi:hypothetical protein